MKWENTSFSSLLTGFKYSIQVGFLVYFQFQLEISVLSPQKTHASVKSVQLTTRKQATFKYQLATKK